MNVFWQKRKMNLCSTSMILLDCGDLDRLGYRKRLLDAVKRKNVGFASRGNARQVAHLPQTVIFFGERRNERHHGIVVLDLPYEPLQRLMLGWVDWRRFYADLAKEAVTIEEFVGTLERKYERELFPIAGNSPSEIVRYGSNVNSLLVSPPMIQSYYLSSYTKFAEILSVHMDGRLGNLAEEIAESNVDVVEAFTPFL